MMNQLKTILLLGVLSAVFVSLGGLFGPSLLLPFALVALALNLGAYFYSDRVVLAMHRARELGAKESPTLHRVVEELAARANVPKPRLYIIDEAAPNAFATGRNPRHGVVAVTRGLLERLSPRQVRAVLAHEIAHIKNRDILIQSIAAVIAGAVTYVAQALGFSALFGGREGGSPVAALAVAIVAPFAAVLIQLGISRSREFRADEVGAEISGDPEALASALAALDQRSQAALVANPATASLFIVNPLRGGDRQGLESLMSTHPATEERIRRLLAMSDGRGASRVRWMRGLPARR